jgi:phage gp16-like protein
LAAAAAMFEALGPVGVRRPWQYADGDAEPAFRNARTRALRRVGAAR